MHTMSGIVAMYSYLGQPIITNGDTARAIIILYDIVCVADLYILTAASYISINNINIKASRFLQVKNVTKILFALGKKNNCIASEISVIVSSLFNNRTAQNEGSSRESFLSSRPLVAHHRRQVVNRRVFETERESIGSSLFIIFRSVEAADVNVVLRPCVSAL
jgi:hypothetical protein